MGATSSKDVATAPDKWFYILRATKEGNVTELEAMLNENIDFKVPPFCPSLLHVAAKNGHLKIVELLLNYARSKFNSAEDILKEAFPTPRGENGYPYDTPLTLAAKFAHIEVVETLLELYMDSNIEDMGYPLHAAMQNNCCENFESWKIIVEQVPRILNEPDLNGVHAITFAAKKIPVDDKILNFLLDMGADANVTDTNNRRMTPLHYVAWLGSGTLRLVPHLLKKTSDIDIIDKLGRTPLFLATLGRKEDNVRILIANGADPTIKGGDLLKNMTLPLTVAAGYGDFEIVKLLAIVTPHKSEYTAVEKAALAGHNECLEYLLKEGFYASQSLLSDVALLSHDVSDYQAQKISTTLRILLEYSASFGKFLNLHDFLSVDTFSISETCLMTLCDFGLVEQQINLKSTSICLIQDHFIQFHNDLRLHNGDYVRKFEVYLKYFPYLTILESMQDSRVVHTTVVSTLPNLDQLCRWAIRHHIVRVHEILSTKSIEKLPLPNSLRSFLSYGGTNAV